MTRRTREALAGFAWLLPALVILLAFRVLPIGLSVRMSLYDWGMAGATALVLRLRGDGKRYRINLRTPNTPSAFRFEAPLDLPAGEWREVEVPVSALRAKAFGRAVPLVGPPDPARVRQVGFMISDAQAGPFRLEIDWIGWK